MIARLRGELAEINGDHLVLWSGSVGYELLCSQETLQSAREEKSLSMQFFVYTHVREDSLQLFGFWTAAEKSVFLHLLKVNGIGPKMALNILSGTQTPRLLQLIENEDVKGLSQLPKVGKKTAEQMILTLKGKLILAEASVGKSTAQRDLFSALVNLGFKAQDVERVIEDLPKDLSLQDGIRESLSALTHL